MRVQCIILALLLIVGGWYAWKKWGKKAVGGGD